MKDCCERDDATSRVTAGTGNQRALVEKFRGKFIREAQMIAGMDHPHIVRVLDVFEENGTAYYVMDYLPGGSLADKIKTEGPLPEMKAEEYIRQVADALSYIHSRNTVHLDIKPSNILLNAKDKAVVIDFGVSKHYDDLGEQTSSTPVGISKGYAPLEQGRDGDVNQFGPSTDIYSLGATLYYLVTGIIPPEASILNEDGLTRPNGISSHLWNAIEMAMQPRRKDRPQNIDGFLTLISDSSSNLSSIDEDKTIIANRPEEKITQSQNSKKMSSWLWVSAVGLGIIVVFGLLLKRLHSSAPSNDTSVSISENNSSNIVTTETSAPAIDHPSNENKGEKTNTSTSPIIKLKRNKYEITTTIGYKFKLSYSTESSNPVKWTSSNKSVLAVDNNGLITVRGAGSSTITASIDNGHDTCVCIIHIQSEDEKDKSNTTNSSYSTASESNNMSILRSELTLDIGHSFLLSAYNYGSSLTWESENPSIATVTSSGNVTALRPGKVMIMAKGSSGTKECLVTVVAIAKGSASPGEVNVYQGQTVQLNVPGYAATNWESDNPKIATVTSFGLAQGVKAGETNIWGYINGAPKRFYIRVHVMP